MNWNRMVVAGVAVIALALAPGCVTKKVFQKNVEDTDARLAGVESGVETNERRIGDLTTDTDAKIASVRGTAEKAVELGSTALGKAESAQETAEKAARGRLLWTVTLSDDSVKFSFDQASVPPDAARVLDDLATQVKGMDKAVYLEIEGHTDSIGSEEYNQMLGERRANAVRVYLNEKGGIPLHAMNVISFGESRPVADNRTPQGRSQNRRVVIRVLE
jgi:peptidoglycan-associated lipoprotein